MLKEIRNIRKLSTSATVFNKNSYFTDELKSKLVSHSIISKFPKPSITSSIFQVKNPSDLTILAELPDMSAEDTEKLVDDAKRTFDKERHDWLLNLNKLMLENEKDLATLITLESGKPLAEGLGEVRYAAGFISWFGEEALRNYGDFIPSPIKNHRYVTIRQPVGVCGIITPWNFPLAMLARKVGAAVAAGCTTVLKPASETPLSCLAFETLVQQAGIPDGVVNTITTHTFTKDVGNLLCTSDKINKISFTGSTEVGKLLMRDAASTVKKVSLELGGNAPFIVFDDADAKKAAEDLIAAKFRNAGQTCVCPNRVYVHQPILPIFVQHLETLIQNLKVGDGLDSQVTVGPLINPKATDKVHSHVVDAIDRGATLHYGGSPVEGRVGAFYQPTLLSNVPPNALLSRQETFGPVLAIIPFATEDEVVEMANSTEFGLATYLYTNSLSRAWNVAERIEAGMVAINSPSVSTNVAPFGGVKQSGLGREGSKYGLDDYTELKFVTFGI